MRKSVKSEKRDFDKMAATWDEEPARVRLAVDVAKAIASVADLDQALDVLDFGCGTGLLTLLIQPYVRSVTGLDSSRGMLDRLEAKAAARGLGNVKAKLADLDSGDSLEGRYGLITSSMAFHHVRAIGPLLAKLYGATAPGGRLCVADLDPEGGQFHPDSTGVFHEGFDRTALKKHLEEAGYLDVADRTAATMTRPAAGGGTRTFSVFLITGLKPAG